MPGKVFTRDILRRFLEGERQEFFMKTSLRNRFFKKVLVPIVHGCEQTSAIAAARAIAGEENVMLVGLI
jgi:hypothetical protein